MSLQYRKGRAAEILLHLGEDVEELALGDVAVQVANVKGGVVLGLVGILALRPWCSIVCYCGCHVLCI